MKCQGFSVNKGGALFIDHVGKDHLFYNLGRWRSFGNTNFKQENVTTTYRFSARLAVTVQKKLQSSSNRAALIKGTQTFIQTPVLNKMYAK